jgi:ComF family protein
MMLWQQIKDLLFPPKCVLCHALLENEETDLCASCRKDAPGVAGRREKIRYLADWTGVWYYEKEVRKSLHRYKFKNRRGYAACYGQLLAMAVARDLPQVDVLTWVPISASRKRKRGYDQGELLARAVAAELGLELQPLLQKVRDNPPQSSVQGAEARRANVLGVFTAAGNVAGKRILLLDDILTTGATASECARVLRTAGAQEVYAAAVAVARKNNNKTSR